MTGVTDVILWMLGCEAARVWHTIDRAPRDTWTAYAYGLHHEAHTVMMQVASWPAFCEDAS